MSILFYAKEETAGILLKTIESFSPGMEVFRNVANLMERFRLPIYDPAIVVLVADSRESLKELLVLRHLFRNVRLILVLPDREPATVSMGHALHARFLAYMDSDPLEVALVLSRMMERAKTQVSHVIGSKP